MCEQCTASTIRLATPIPGYALLYATQKGDMMKPGDYGLVESNDPTYVFSKPTPDPVTDHDDDNDPGWDEFFNTWVPNVEIFEECLKGPPEAGYRLTEACKKAGYDIQNDGRLAFWLFDHLGKCIEQVSHCTDPNHAPNIEILSEEEKEKGFCTHTCPSCKSVLQFKPHAEILPFTYTNQDKY